MRFYSHPHRHTSGIDLHARSMYLCVLDEHGQVVLHKGVLAAAAVLLDALGPFREHLVIGVECMFSWYWVADLCAREGIPFVLAHALSMGAIHGSKSKNDRIDALKIAKLLKGGMFPMGYVYPRAMRNREGIGPGFDDPSTKRAVELDLGLSDVYDQRLCSVPGIGKILAMTILYEIHDIARFPRVQEFASYARLVKGAKESAGKRKGTSGAKMGNVHLKWAFSEAAVLFLAKCEQGKALKARLDKKYGKGKALSILAHKIGRAVFHMLTRKTAFDLERFLKTS